MRPTRWRRLLAAVADSFFAKFFFVEIRFGANADADDVVAAAPPAGRRRRFFFREILFRGNPVRGER